VARPESTLHAIIDTWELTSGKGTNGADESVAVSRRQQKTSPERGFPERGSSKKSQQFEESARETLEKRLLMGTFTARGGMVNPMISASSGSASQFGGARLNHTARLQGVATNRSLVMRKPFPATEPFSPNRAGLQLVSGGHGWSR
jgi:hypothetical protein